MPPFPEVSMVSPTGLEPAAPAELPGDHCRREVAPDARVRAGARRELDRVVAIDRDGEGAAHADVLQRLALHAVDRRAPASVVRRVESGPQTEPRVVDHVALHGVERIALELPASEEIVV